MQWIAIGDRVIELDAGLVYRAGESHPLSPRLHSLLRHFVENPDTVIRRDALIEAVWGHLEAATDDSVNVAVSSLRQVLGDTRRPHQVLKVVPRRGYLFDSSTLRRLDADEAAALTARGKPASEASAQVVPPDANRGRAAGLPLAATGLVAVAIVAIGLMVVAGILPTDNRPSDVAEPLAEATPSATVAVDALPDKSVAVLPFSDFSPDGENQWFADGLSEEILNSLVRVPDLLVAARTSSFTFRESTLPVSEIGRELGVAHVLEGSVRLGDDRVRVTARLTRSSDGFHVWSNNFDRQTADIIGIQEELARQISMALETRMDPEALAAMASAGTNSVEAYRNYIQGRASGTTSAPEAYAFFERARELDPGFAAAHYHAALYWQFQGNLTVHSRTELDLGLPEIRRRFADRIEAAIESADDPVAALLYRGVEAREQFRFSDAVALFRRYVSERPGDFPAWLQVMELAYIVGDDALHEQALAVYRERSLNDRVAAIQYLVHAYRTTAPEQWIDHAFTLATRWPDAFFVQYQIHRALLWVGRVAEAQAFHDRLLQMDASPRAKFLVQLRQACAEDRDDDAFALYEADPEPSSEWFVLDVLSRSDEADAVLRIAEIEHGTHGLLNFLLYPQFDARKVPSLVRVLEREGIEVREPTPVPFACDPIDDDVDGEGFGQIAPSFPDSITLARDVLAGIAN